MEKKAVSAHICVEVLSQKFDHALSYKEVSRRRGGEASAILRGLPAISSNEAP